jgi:hypothetical protein
MNIKVYLDTSVINFLFADDPPEKKEITIDFFENFIRTKKESDIKEINIKNSIEHKLRIITPTELIYYEE